MWIDPYDGHPLPSLLNRYGIRLKHQYGQNFLSDPRHLARIVAAAGVTPGDHVIEVGMGAGALTAALLQAGATVTAYEIDTRLSDLLHDRFREADALDMIFADALKRDWSADLRHARDRGAVIRVVANVPYNITTPLLERFLTEVPDACQITLLLQKEAVERLMATSGKAYGPTAVLCRHYGTLSRAFDLPASVFFPKPHVDSSVLTLIRQDPIEADIKGFNAFVHACFHQRRKTLRNNLQAVAGSADVSVTKTPVWSRWAAVLQVYDLKLSNRPEQIAPEIYLKLYQEMIKK